MEHQQHHIRHQQQQPQATQQHCEANQPSYPYQQHQLSQPNLRQHAHEPTMIHDEIPASSTTSSTSLSLLEQNVNIDATTMLLSGANIGTPAPSTPTISSIRYNNNKMKVVAGYVLQEKLGSGSFAVVYKGVRLNSINSSNYACEGATTTDFDTAPIVAIKAIDRSSDKLTPKVLSNLEKEISILRNYKHRNIVCLQDVQKTTNHFYLLLEYCAGGDLQKLIRDRANGRLSERLCRRLMKDLCSGLQFLHDYQLIHRDIKPQNLLLTGALPLVETDDPSRTQELENIRNQINFPSNQFSLKIADFGFARHLQTTSLAETLCGSPLYMAPEILSHQRYDDKADLWSVGTVLFEMIAGKPPFSGDNHIHLLQNIQKNAVRLPPGVRVSKECVALLRILLNRNPSSRATFHEFVSACNTFVSLGTSGSSQINEEKSLNSKPNTANSPFMINPSSGTIQTGTFNSQAPNSESAKKFEDSLKDYQNVNPTSSLANTGITAPVTEQQQRYQAVVTPSFGPVLSSSSSQQHMDAQQLIQVEALCETLYTGIPLKLDGSPQPVTRAEAQQRLLSLQSNSEYIPQCQYILDNSNSHYARLVASNSLIELITVHWNNFTVPQRIDIRNYVLGYLANKGPNLQDFLVLSLIKLVCRITKLGWFDDATHRDLADDVTKFLQASINHCILGLKILNQLVDELNIPTAGRTLTQHRKTSVSFRDVSLLKVFQLGLTTLKQVQTGAIAANPVQRAQLGEQALSLAVRCLNFDFIGTNPDESTEDVGTIQAPTSWRLLLLDPATTELLFYFYANTEPPQSAKSLEAIILLSSVRRSLFPTDKDRAAFLGRLINGIREILSKRTGLQHQDNYHQICRLLGRLKANYQLSELVKADGYLEWLELAASFTVQSVENWQYSTNSIHYLLALWARLVAAVPYVRPETGARGHVAHLEKQVLLVTETYVNSMLGSVETVLRSDGALEDPLDDDGSLKEQLDRLPVICRFQYGQVASRMLNKIDPLLTQYRGLVESLGINPTSAAPPDIQQRVAIIEGQLTWLTYIIGATVGGHSWSSAHMTDGEETIDASLSRRILQLAQGMEYRLTQSGGAGRTDPRLEQAVLFYFQNFRRVYMFMWDQMSGTTSAGSGKNAPSVVGKKAAKLDSAAGGSGASSKQKIYQRMFDHLGMGDHTNVANLIVTKMGNNLKYWPEDQDLIGKTLDLLHDMAQGYSSSKLLLTLETVRYLARNHTEEHFPFLSILGNARHRTTFHATMTRLLLSPAGEEKLNLTFEQFLEPIVNKLAQLGALSQTDLRREDCRLPLIGVFRDLRGITASLHNRKAYSALFDILHPNHLPLLSKVAHTWHDQNDVVISLLRFLHEFCHNKANRVNFDQSSPNGILLFRCTSDVVCAYGNCLLSAPAISSNNSDIYKKRYKGLSLALNILNSALGGNYVCFGVFELYNDRALDNSLDVALRLALTIPLDDIIAYPKLSKAYYSFIEILFRNHRKNAFALDTNVFMQIMACVHDGLQSSDATISAYCANTIDHMASFSFTNQGKDKIEMHNLNKHLLAQPNLYSSLTATLFNLLLYGPSQNHWAVMRPMLSLMLANEQSFTQYKDSLLSTQSAENQAKLNDALNKLLADVNRSLDNANRDRFTQKLTAFRIAVRSFLTL